MSTLGQPCLTVIIAVQVTSVPDAVAVGVFLLLIGDEGTIVTRVTQAVVIVALFHEVRVQLKPVRCQRTIVEAVRNSVRI